MSDANLSDGNAHLDFGRSDEVNLILRAIQQQEHHGRLQRFAISITIVGAFALALAGLASGYGLHLLQSGGAPAAKAVFLAVAGFVLFASISFLYARLILAGIADEDSSLRASFRIREIIAHTDSLLPQIRMKAEHGKGEAGGAVGAA
ncbi:MAG: hypothetical protein CMM77_15845 [Rhodospirillaceae bacterium]|nr:hypothetical protein [Magnetovibrio sp.]MAY68586.1 hypothetical protein [Rhodospirillaceae bacterium]